MPNRDDPGADSVLSHTLVLGGARSGKSAYAESLIARAGGGVYIATAEPRDDEMRARIIAHRARRGDSWTTIEEPLDLGGALRRAAGFSKPVLVDCLTLWVSNLLAAGRDPVDEADGLCRTLGGLNPAIVFVSNETGGGIVPDNALARAFRDAAGVVNQRFAAAVDDVYLVTAGLPVKLK